MTTSYTSGLRLTNQPSGGNSSTWGDIADANFEFIDDAITRVQEVDMTGGNSQTLTIGNGVDDQARSAVLEITGTPSSANSIIIPDSEKIYAIHAQHVSVTGGITVRTNSGTGVSFLTGERGWVYCDSVSVYDLTPTVSALDPSQNLSDLQEASAARNNLGLNETLVTYTSSDENTLISFNGSGEAVKLQASGDFFSINASSGVITVSVVSASDSLSGIAKFATTAEMISGTGNVIVSPAILKNNVGFSNYFESSGLTLTAGSQSSVSHGLGSVPKFCKYRLECISNDGDFVVGDAIYDLDIIQRFGSTAVQEYGLILYANSSSIFVNVGDNGIRYINSSGGIASLSLSNWEVVVQGWV